VHFRLLGPLQVVRGDATVEIRAPKQRAVLAMLLLAQGRVVSVDRLISGVWGEDPPSSATASLQVYISHLRRALRDGAATASPIVRQPPGYYLDVPAGSVDVAVFSDCCARAAAAVEQERWVEALSAADDALALWRGDLLEDVGDQEWVTRDAARVREVRNVRRIACSTA